jgi:hypothetical protein
MPGMIGRGILFDEQASPNYRLREVKQRRTGETRLEVVEVVSQLTVIGCLADREKAPRIVRGWERLSQRIEGGPSGHALVH